MAPRHQGAGMQISFDYLVLFVSLFCCLVSYLHFLSFSVCSVCDRLFIERRFSRERLLQ